MTLLLLLLMLLMPLLLILLLLLPAVVATATVDAVVAYDAAAISELRGYFSVSAINFLAVISNV